TTRSPCRPSADPVDRVAPADKAQVDPGEPEDKAEREGPGHPVVPGTRPIGLRADPRAAILPPMDRVQNAGQAAREAQAVGEDLVAADSGRRPSRLPRNKSD